MSAYHTDEVSFELPEGYVDHSMNVLRPPADVTGFSLVVTRQSLEGNEVAPFVSEILKGLGAKWPGFKILGQRERKVGPIVGREARVRWAPKGQPIYQHQVYVPYYGVALIFTASCSFRFATQCESHLNQVLATVKLRRQ